MELQGNNIKLGYNFGDGFKETKFKLNKTQINRHD